MKKLTDLEIDVFNASILFCEVMNKKHKENVFYAEMFYAPSCDPGRSISIKNISVNNNFHYKAMASFTNGDVSFPEENNIDEEYGKFIRDYLRKLD